MNGATLPPRAPLSHGSHSIDATVQVEKKKKPEVQAEDQTLALFQHHHVRPQFNIYSYPVLNLDFQEGPDKPTTVLHCLRNYILHRVRTMGLCPGQTIVRSGFRAKPVTWSTSRFTGGLEGNLEGDRCRSHAIVFLPPSYEKDKNTIYPGCLCAACIRLAPKQCARDSRPADR